MKIIEPLYIKTPSAVLRPWKRSDLESLVFHADNPKIAANMRDGFPGPYSTEDACRFIEMTENFEDGFILAIEVDGNACGSIGIHILNDIYRKTAEIGYWLGEPFWGRGIITDAVRAVVPVAFGTFDIARIQAGIFERNRASAGVLEKCGFIREAVLKDAIFKNGELMDEIMYSKFPGNKNMIFPETGLR
ncbi:MAG: GNAT family N-acetyltransferase [Methanomicrobiaceae archaeon]|nr:GNAT family N-acetyltransferase [Methanomicrobiaceae archaeon]